MITALVCYLLATVLISLLEPRLLQTSASVEFAWWINRHVTLPILRISAILILLFTGYPQIYGLTTAPSLVSLIGEPDRAHHLINLLFVIGLILPLLPGIGLIGGIVVPLQAATGASMLFVWLCQALQVNPSLWVGWPALSGCLFFIILAQAAVMVVSRPDSIDFPFSLQEFIMLMGQIPAIMIFCHALGSQL